MDDERAPFVSIAGVILGAFLPFDPSHKLSLVFHPHLRVESSEAVAATEFLLVPSTWLHTS